ncbi:MAG: adenylate/guanylate cyclase domain-containing protein [Vicinamibacterales bacterium]
MRFRSLRTRLVVAIGGLVIALTVATLTFVGRFANQAVNERVSADLVRSRDTLTARHAARYDRLELVSRLLASFPDLLALLGTDAATIRDFLTDYRERNARDELLVVLGPQGQVIARSDTFAPLTLPEARTRWLEPALGGQPARGVIEVDGKPHHLVLVAAEAGGTVFGFVGAGAPIDDRWAAALRDASGKEIAVLTPSALAGTTLAPGRAPWAAGTAAPRTPDGSTAALDLGGERFEALTLPDPYGDDVRVVAMQSLDLALAPYRNIQAGLVGLGVVAAIAGLAAAAAMARSITAPIAVLSRATADVAEGRFDVRIPVDGQDEIARLSTAFNHMTEGLRERADMQKFVSQSTVEMIQRGPQTPEDAAGRRRTITLLFSDIRGFTAFAERRPPEEAVAALNRYLQLQADLVQKFRGDVDKFMGDAVFAHFTGEDMALDAIRCAVEMHRAVQRAPADDPTLPSLALGIGIVTGEVIVGSVGGGDRQDYTAVGAPVNLAARLCAAAEPNQTLMSATTYEAVRGLVAAEAIPPLTVKGVSAPVGAFRMRT